MRTQHAYRSEPRANRVSIGPENHTPLHELLAKRPPALPQEVLGHGVIQVVLSPFESLTTSNNQNTSTNQHAIQPRYRPAWGVKRERARGGRLACTSASEILIKLVSKTWVNGKGQNIAPQVSAGAQCPERTPGRAVCRIARHRAHGPCRRRYSCTGSQTAHGVGRRWVAGSHVEMNPAESTTGPACSGRAQYDRMLPYDITRGGSPCRAACHTWSARTTHPCNAF